MVVVVTNFVRSCAIELLALLGPGRCFVGVDGVDGSGKTTFATSLGEALSRYRPTVVIHMDDFLNPATIRHARGRSSAEGFWLDSYDYNGFSHAVVRPLTDDGDGWYVPAIFDVVTDTAVVAEPILAPHDAVAIVEGLFLHRDELRGLWDASIFLDVPFEVTAARMADRDGTSPDPDDPSMRRYVQGKLLYFAAARPWERATLVIDNSRAHSPHLVDPSASQASRSRWPD